MTQNRLTLRLATRWMGLLGCLLGIVLSACQTLWGSFAMDNPECRANPAACAGDASNPDGSFTPSPPVCNVDPWCWQNPLPQGNHLYGVWGSDANNVWAVGLGGTIVKAI